MRFDMSFDDIMFQVNPVYSQIVRLHFAFVNVFGLEIEIQIPKHCFSIIHG